MRLSFCLFVNEKVSPPVPRVLEDYAVVFFGSVLFKIIRLFVVAAFVIHLHACLFYRIKVAFCTTMHRPRTKALFKGVQACVKNKHHSC